MPASNLQMLVVGLDGATFDVINPLIAAGRLPVLSDLMKRGCHGKLRSTRPPYTPVAWTTMMTGCNPGKHGIYYFVELQPGTYDARILNGSDVRVPNVWEVLDQHGLRSGLFNIPWTYPPLNIGGFCISGMDAPRFDKTMAHPPQVFEQIRDAAEVGGLNLNLSGLTTQQAAWPVVQRHIAVFGQLMRKLAATSELDVFMPVFMQADNVGHYFWEHEDDIAPDDLAETLIGKTYQKIDEELGKLLAMVAGPDTTILVVSDHGFCRGYGTLNVNMWLESLGLLKFAKESSTSKLFRLGQKLFKHLRPAWKQAVRNRFWSKRVRRQRLCKRASSHFDWERTKVFASIEFGGLTLNLQGRRPQGIVGPDGGLAEIRGHLEAAAQELIDPATDEPIISEIVTREELYDGPFVERAPELWLIPRDEAYYLALNWLGSPRRGENAIFTPAHKPMGHHHPDGIFIAAGAGIRHIEQPLAGLDLLQIAPTIAHRFGLRLPKEVDGRRLQEIFAGDLALDSDAPEAEWQADFVREQQQYTPEEAAMIGKRLQDLGYF